MMEMTEYFEKKINLMKQKVVEIKEKSLLPEIKKLDIAPKIRKMKNAKVLEN